jgi:hypothetical protein
MRVLLFLSTIVIFQQAIAGNGLADKVIAVRIEESGIILVGRDTVTTENLSRYIQERLFKSYLGTGRMHNRISFSKSSENIPALVTDIVVKEIKEGQQRALRQLCAEKYKKQYEKLSNHQQEKLQKLYPVLFQTDYTTN